MSDKLVRRPEKAQRERPDSSPFLPPGYTAGSKHSGSPTTQGDRVSGSDTTFHAPANNAIDNATALFASAKRQHGGVGATKSPIVDQSTDAVPGTVSTMSSLPSHRFQQSVRDLAPQSGVQPTGTAHQNPGGLFNQNTMDRDAAEEPLLIKTSLLDPHPIIIPPPGSRLAFAGATSREVAHKFRSLPTLEDALLRRAKAPLCLFNYWQYLADIEACPEELEFWLSLADYEDLYRSFVRSEMATPVPASQRDSGHDRPQPLSLGPAGSRLRSGRVESGALGQQTIGTGPGTRRGRPIEDLDKETQELDKYLAGLSLETTLACRNTCCQKHRQCREAHRPFTQAHISSRPTLDAPQRPVRQRGLRGFISRIFSGEPASAGSTGVAGAQWNDHPQENQDIPLLTPSTSAEPKHAVDAPTEDDMRRSAEKLYTHYICPGAPSELYIGPQMREEISSRVERDGRFDPDLFAPVKRHAYESMRNESYMRFVRERLMHNITRGTAAPRIVFGLTLIFVALSFQLSLIFLNVKPKAWRWLPLAGLWPGFINLFAGVTRLDPFLAILGVFEPVSWRLESVRDSSIRDSHLKRASLQLIATAVVAVLITLVMFLVPGNRL
ncbi:Bud site selection protein, Revert to axial protein 1 [Coemansia erecta]|uniref:Bud site selection protein, Revert to axial protein 1 n=1 Tax=Coemansia erecta TaxID=147472 RepID=A0A9W8CSM0_9FUNG|nr:Bud site selection protein, Revert to axial protein 1 [Coemansia erecta]